VDVQARRRLLRWYRRHARDLPWRRSRDPYAVWVSEAMLQQTRVDVAMPYFLRWMERFPSAAALAAAPEEEAVRLWAGLGYYSRARNLHRAARVVVERHDGRVPDTVDALRALPGVGPYTAGAVASIAFGRRVPAVDGNVVRVASRIAALRDPSTPAARRRIDALAASWVPARAAGDWNQALMDLGATVCVPRSPRCGECPIASACQANVKGLAHRIPAPRRRAAPRMEEVRFAALTEGDRLLLVRNPPGLLGGMWSLPGGAARSPADLRRLVREQAGIEVRLRPRAAKAVHAFSHRTWRMRVHKARVQRESGATAQERMWAPLAGLATLGLPAATRTALAAVGIQA
jgi:A/G-specific adenine glycosylase